MTGVVLILFMMSLLSPLVTHSRKKPDQTEGVNNLRQIGNALLEFEAEYGKFPNESTIDAVKVKTGTTLSLGKEPRMIFFRQLIATGIRQSESMFYSEGNGSKRPDDVTSRGKALEKGECGFAYLAGQSSMGISYRPLVVTPIIPGTDRFDPRIFDGKALIFKMDNSVTAVNIDKNGHAMLQGMNLLDPTHPMWGGEKWTLVWPE